MKTSLRPIARGLLQRRGDAAGGHDVVFLDQDAVIEAEAVVGAAAAGDGVFLRQAQAGQGLAGVDDACAGAGHGVDVEARDGGGGREQLQEIEGGALGGEQGAGVGFDFAQHLAGAMVSPSRSLPANHGQRIERRKQASNQAVPASTASSRLMTVPSERGLAGSAGRSGRRRRCPRPGRRARCAGLRQRVEAAFHDVRRVVGCRRF
jgi:hypothetical protein